MKRIIITLSAMAAIIACHGQRNASMPEITFTPQQKLHYAEKIIESYYVDDVNSDKIVQEAIVAMLKTLDPHSSYSDPEETKELTTPLEGNFSGIGIQFNMLNDTLFVIQTTSGGPSEKVGILPGDRILSAGDSIISGVKSPNSRILKILRGPKGSRVDLKVLRKGVKEPIDFSITRDDIPIYSIDAAYMADPQTGYIRISRFAEETDAEFRKAVKKLRSQGMKQLIIDLEDNGGGYLNAAHQLASHFLKKGDLVVYTDAPKMGKMVYGVEQPGDLQTEKVVVLANQYSASASEILSGALQDNDRGLIVGRRTFGKGLVQRPFPFPDGSMIRLTVSKYYTPAGRSIQKPYAAGDEESYRKDIIHRYEAGEFSSEDSIHLPDSLRFETLHNHRPVYGGGGIMPDLFIPADTTDVTPYFIEVTGRNILYRYTIEYADRRREALDAVRTLDELQRLLDDDRSLVPDFVAYAARHGVAPNRRQIDRSRRLIEAQLRAYIGRNTALEENGFYANIHPIDPVTTRAIALLRGE